jgi:hypothetical protein
MYTYLVQYNNKIIGSFNEAILAENFILSCLQNNLMQHSAKVLKFRTNSCYCDGNYDVGTIIQSLPITSIVETIVQPVSIEKEPVKEKKFIDFENPEVIKISQEKIELQHKINMLKASKEKIKESKSVYENDLKLFNLFSESLAKDPKFIISDLFKDKYNIIKKLKDEDRLSWENFSSEYKTENYYGDYFGTNDYEENFMANDDNINEELEI